MKYRMETDPQYDYVMRDEKGNIPAHMKKYLKAVNKFEEDKKKKGNDSVTKGFCPCGY